MRKPFRKTGQRYLALFMILTQIICALAWVYRVVARALGEDLALIALTLLVSLVAAGLIRGILYASQLERYLRDLAQPQGNLPVQKPGPEPPEEEASPLELFDFERPKPPSGKQSRFPEEKIRRAVLKWERRDRNFPARTLEEFLEQEFGSGADGVLLMAPTTFYGWRKRLLNELKNQKEAREGS